MLSVIMIPTWRTDKQKPNKQKQLNNKPIHFLSVKISLSLQADIQNYMFICVFIRNFYIIFNKIICIVLISCFFLCKIFRCSYLTKLKIRVISIINQSNPNPLSERRKKKWLAQVFVTFFIVSLNNGLLNITGMWSSSHFHDIEL